MRERRLNGWQRIWIVLTAISLVGGGVLFPAWAALQHGVEWNYRFALEKDYESGACELFIKEPLETLLEPPYGDGNGGTCWHLYTSRTTDTRQGHPATPYTMEVFEANLVSDKWGEFWLGVGILIPTILFGAGLVYLVGWLIAWIRRGFRQA